MSIQYFPLTTSCTFEKHSSTVLAICGRSWVKFFKFNSSTFLEFQCDIKNNGLGPDDDNRPIDISGFLNPEIVSIMSSATTPISILFPKTYFITPRKPCETISSKFHILDFCIHENINGERIYTYMNTSIP